MQTWAEMSDEIASEIGGLAPHTRITKIGNLKVLSMAQHLLQKKTSAVKRFYDLQMAALQSVGYTSVSRDLGTIMRAEYAVSNANPPSAEVKVVSAETFDRIVRGEHVVGYCTDDFALRKYANKLWVYPFAGVTGIVRIHYLPNLTPYSPSDTDNWPGYGTDPWLRMKQDGPEPEFNAAINGMIAYGKWKLVGRIPGARQEYRAEIQEWQAEWLSCFNDVVLDHPPADHSIGDVGWFSPVK